MADKAVSELIEAERITSTDLFVLEQNGTAKKLTGQVLLNWLTAAADGHGGIQSIQKVGSSGLTDTYRITLADTTTFDFVVTNGKSVENITKTGSSGLVDTYIINYTGGTTSTFTVTNGAKGDKGDSQYVWIKYASQQPTASSHSFGDVPDNWIGIYSGGAAAAPTDWQQYKWFQIKGPQGNTGVPATLTGSAVEYQVSDSGTIIPSGSWSASVPVVAQGKYLWTRTTNTFNTGAPVVAYSVSRMGLDGSGSVSSVANISPDSGGNVPLTAEHVGAVPATGGDMTGELKMNGQPISGLNMPTANDQAANMGYVSQQVKKAAPRNLLDNSDFRNPVNQRGQTTYGGSNVYTIDRWYSMQWSPDGTSVTTVSVESNGLRISGGIAGAANQCNISQKISADRLSGKTLTFAVKNAEYTAPDTRSAVNVLVDGNLIKQTTATNGGISVCTFTVPDDAEIIIICIGNNSSHGGRGVLNMLLEWAALYEGEYTAETLPEHQTPDYQDEYDKCQRYLFPLGGGFSGGDFALPGFIGSGGAFAEFTLPKRMRITGVCQAGSFENFDPSNIKIGVSGNNDVFVLATGVTARIDGNGYPVLRVTLDTTVPMRCPAVMICTDGNIRYSQEL